MITLLGYQILNLIYESPNSLVYRSIRERDKQAVILKVLKEDYPTSAELTRYKQEYEIIRSLNLAGVIRAEALEKYQNTLILVLEDFGGESLQILIPNQRFTIKKVLSLAIKIAEVLGELHAINIIHRDINPSNIVFNPETDQLKLIDFGLSTVLSRENTTFRNPNVLEGTLAYISPEQTGRMNRSLDYRTDFYSLGATFYELLTNQLPFDTTDAMELVHCHIAKQPVPPHELNSEIPKAISNIVMKLLAKTAEKRYQSAWGIKADLEECLFQLQSNGQVSDFPLGRHDISDKFQIPQKLYGREAEVETLLTAFERVSGQERLTTDNGQLTTNKSEMMVVAGYSGIGKSVLVQEIYKPITQQRGYFISGKFDQFQRNIPYSAVVSAFSDLVQQLLTETEAQLSDWREKLLAAVGVNGQVVIDVIPEVELIIGKQPIVQKLAPAESQNRFNLVFQNFIRVFTQPEHSLVIFIDDLQWADTASLKLIKLLMTAPNSQCLFLIGAYRDNEVSAAHPLMLTVDEIQQSGGIVNQIFLAPLCLSDVNQLISDALKSALEKTLPLAELVLAKTHGNPFFMNEFLKSLYTEELIKFDRERGGWQWDLEQIQARGFTDNVVELMALKIQKLKPDTQQALQLAAAIANQFDLHTLASSRQKSLKETVLDLHEAVAEGLVLPLSDSYKEIVGAGLTQMSLGKSTRSLNPPVLDEPNSVNGLTVEYKFVHDRIQQAAYSLIPPEVRQAIHLQVGQLLLHNTPQELQEQKIFDIVNQLNSGSELITDQSQRDELAQLNLIAGKKAKASTAYEPAFNYLTLGMGLLNSSLAKAEQRRSEGESSWQRQYDLTLALYVEAAEAAYLSTDFEQMEHLAEVVLQRSRTVLEKVKVYEIKIQAFAAQNKLLEAIKIALQVLKLLGVRFPEKIGKWTIRLRLLKTKLVLAHKPIEDLIELPEMTDPYKLAAMRILASAIPATFIAAPKLFPLIVLKQVNLSVKYGNASGSAFAYATYGLILCGMVLDIESGYRFGQLALRVLDKFNASELKAKTLFIVHDFITHWKEHTRETLKPLLEAYSAGLETGDLEFAAYSAFIYTYHSYCLGKELAELESEIAAYAEATGQFKQTSPLHWQELYRQAVLNLMGKTENPCRLMGEAYNEEKMLPLHQSVQDRNIIYQLFLHKLILNYLFCDYQQASETSAIAEKYLNSAMATLRSVLFYLYDSLTWLAVFPGVHKSRQNSILKKVASNQKKMKKWAHHAPMNHLHKFYLVEAERYNVLGQVAKAMDCYDRAIALAKEHDYINEEALAHELAAKFYLAQGKAKIAQLYMLDAHYCYRRWGATAKVKDLETRYAQLFERMSDSTMITALGASGTRAPNFLTQTSTAVRTTETGNSQVLDLATVMKASQVISSEIVLDKLLAKLMKILIENAGAQKGFLILETKGRLLIEAEGAVEHDSVTVLQSVPIETLGASDSILPLSPAIINYVARTKESVVLNNAACEGKFTNDPYIKETKPKSILCVPLLNQGKLISIVYLENNLTTGAFTPDRLEVLKLLSSQAAISIDLAKLYSEVRANESRLAQFLDAMPVGVAILDAMGKPYYANGIAQQLLGKGVVPLTTRERLPEVYQLYRAGTNQVYPREKMSLVRALNGEKATADDIEIHQAGKIIPIETWGTPIFDEKGKVAYAIVAFQDISERKKAEAERLKFTSELFQLNEAFSRFVPRQFLQFLDKESIVDVKLGDQVQKEMSVLFADIRNFTGLSETMTPEQNFRFINAYLSRMEPMIIEHQGFIDKYVGDEIMALFSSSADDAVKAGIAMLHQLSEYNQHRANSGYVPIRIGIGINTGSLMLGTVGGHHRMDTTVISDTVNLASRIEALTKHYEVSLLISHNTFLQLEDANQYTFRIIDRVTVKGKLAAATVYEVFDADLPEIREAKLATKKDFEQALLLYNLGSFYAAARRFQDCLRINPTDRAAQIYLERCQGRY